MKGIFVKICWQLKTPTQTSKCMPCIMQMSYLYASDFPFKNFANLLNMQKQYEKMFEKRVYNDAYSMSIRVQTMINHISIFTFLCSLPQYQRQRKCFFGAQAEKGIARYIDASSVVGTRNFWWFLICSFWACACKLSWTLLSPARVQPL